MNARQSLRIAGFVLLGAAPAAADGARPALGPGSRLWLEGDSTLHEFASSTTVIGWAMERSAGAPADLEAAVRAGAIRGVTATIPVASLRSGTAGLDKNLRTALHADRFPDVLFRLERYMPPAPGATLLTASGALSIAGVSRPVELVATFAPAASGLRLAGRYALLMTAFGVKPPVLMLGAIRVKDSILIQFDLTVNAHTAGPTPATPRRDQP